MCVARHSIRKLSGAWGRETIPTWLHGGSLMPQLVTTYLPHDWAGSSMYVPKPALK